MDNRYPTDEELIKIETWDYTDSFFDLAKFVQSIWNWGEDYAQISGEKTDEFDHKYRELRLITGGWSGNEDIVGALNDNRMFSMLCWQSSHRGGMHIYHIREV